MLTIAVYVEHASGSVRRASLEALGAAAATGHEVVAILAGDGAEGAASGCAGAARAVCIAGSLASPDALARATADAARQIGARAFVASATSTGKDLAPRVAALLGSALLADCTALSATGDVLRATRPTLAGKVLIQATSSGPVFCATLRRNVFGAASGAGPAGISKAAGVNDFKAMLQSIASKTGSKLDVSEAPIVVAGGRGMKGPEHFALLEELAAAFGSAAVGASRAVVDAGWRPHGEQVGQTGKTVAPQLYVAVGISGAIQHLAGMKTSKVIVAINKDPEAPIFKHADYGIVGDAFEVLPVLTQAVKALRAQ
ncbi:MAG: electron transfer flavoprotein subunit alpha/FixB family protein [Planctomycetes bacterium]|nr:electron transfer flavoprotein subunit alpha/FixB family protein [Planctomycetota bacterium]